MRRKVTTVLKGEEDLLSLCVINLWFSFSLSAGADRGGRGRFEIRGGRGGRLCVDENGMGERVNRPLRGVAGRGRGRGRGGGRFGLGGRNPMYVLMV